MYKILLGSFIAMLASAPVFGAPSLTCDASGIGATTPNARMKASWKQNTYNLEWYGDEGNTTPLTVQKSAQSCDYGNALVLPSTNPPKIGYTFIGWEMGEQPACLIPSTDINNTPEYESIGCLDINGAGSCADKSGFDQNAQNYGISDLGQWGVSWKNGDKVTGVALCSAHSGDHHSYQWGGNSADWTATESELTNASGETQYCWCRATGYIANGAEQCSLSSPAWVFDNDTDSAALCADLCAARCASGVRSHSDFRVALFGDSSSGSGGGQACLIPSTDVSTNGNAYAAKSLSDGSDYTNGGATATTYGLTKPGQWGVSGSNGDKVTGVALCSKTSGTYLNTGTPDETGSGDTKYCWCKATHYTANNAQQCSLSSPAWVLNGEGSAAGCVSGCARNCAHYVQYNSDFRVALFGGNVAQ